MLELNPKLVPSHTLYPCNSHGYSYYQETVTTADTLTMDVYTKPIKENTEKCCEVCTVEGEEKYYSIARQWTIAGPWNCGESCMRPEDYDTYLLYEPNLLPANGTNTPCLDNGYDIYLETETHGKGELEMTLDMYTKDQ
jgi:hypothetical protein